MEVDMEYQHLRKGHLHDGSTSSVECRVGCQKEFGSGCWSLNLKFGRISMNAQIRCQMSCNRNIGGGFFLLAVGLSNTLQLICTIRDGFRRMEFLLAADRKSAFKIWRPKALGFESPIRPPYCTKCAVTIAPCNRKLKQIVRSCQHQPTAAQRTVWSAPARAQRKRKREFQFGDSATWVCKSPALAQPAAADRQF